MNTDPLRAQTIFVCKACTSSLRWATQNKQIYTAAAALSQHRLQPARHHQRTQWRAATTITTPKASPTKGKSEKGFWENDWTIFSAGNASLVKKAQTKGDKVLQAKGVPDEETVSEAMKVIEFAASQLQQPVTRGVKTLQETLEAKSQDSKSRTPDGLLTLDRSKEGDGAHPMSVSISTSLLSALAYKILAFPPVFITPDVLISYIKIQTLLGRPEMIPEAFVLYTSKPVPKPNSSPITYSTPNPDDFRQAIPKEAADAALEAAIDSKNLDLAVTIIESSYATKSYQWHRFFTKAAPGMVGITLTPFAAGILASQLPQYFPLANPTELAVYGTAGIMAYVGAISTLGFIVITTMNDHMERVTWATGMPLRERWLREDERAAIDKVAMAWGFKDASKRGDEDSNEWEVLREWCGLRGMILDRTELMEGME